MSISVSMSAYRAIRQNGNPTFDAMRTAVIAAVKLDDKPDVSKLHNNQLALKRSVIYRPVRMARRIAVPSASIEKLMFRPGHHPSVTGCLPEGIQNVR